MKCKRLIHTQTSIDVKVYLSIVRVLFVSKIKVINSIYFPFLFYFYFLFDLFSIFLFLELRVRVRVTRSCSRIK